MNFYVYLYLDQKGVPYYCGKGRRAYGKHKVQVPTDISRIIFPATNLTELWAFALERKFIKWYGRKDNNTGVLENKTDGGEGLAGHKFSESHKQKIAEANKNRAPASAETRAKIGASSKGRYFSPESREKMRNARLGKPSPNLGKPQSAESKAKTGNANRGRKLPPRTDEYRLKMSLAKRKVRQLSS